MTKLLLLLFLSLSLSAFGQKKLDGTFGTPAGYVARSFTFYKDGTFEFGESDCLYSLVGKGKYTINKNNLTLSFDNYNVNENSLIISEKTCGTIENIVFNFFVKDRITTEPIPFLNIFLTDEKGKKKLVNTDINGFASISLPKQPTRIEVKISLIGYKSSTFNLTTEKCQDVKVILNTPFSTIPEATIWEYTIKKATYKELILHGNESSVHPNGYETILTKRNKENE